MFRGEATHEGLQPRFAGQRLDSGRLSEQALRLLIEPHSAFRPQRPVETERLARSVSLQALALSLEGERIHEIVRETVVALPGVPANGRQRRKQHEEIQLVPLRSPVEIQRPLNFWGENALHLLHGLVSDERVSQHAGRVDDAVDAPKAVPTVDEHAIDLLTVRHVCSQIDHFRAHLPELLQPALLGRIQLRPAGQYQARMELSGQILREYQTESTGAACDEIDPSLLEPGLRRIGRRRHGRQIDCLELPYIAFLLVVSDGERLVGFG